VLQFHRQKRSNRIGKSKEVGSRCFPGCSATSASLRAREADWVQQPSPGGFQGGHRKYLATSGSSGITNSTCATPRSNPRSTG
jgi:hypothetical protein